MTDQGAKDFYDRAGIGARLKRGARPGVLVVDFSTGFTDRTCILGSDLDEPVDATRRLLDAARQAELPVFFTTIALNHDGSDGGLWVEKIPNLVELREGTPWIEIDPRLAPRPDEPIVVKKGASAFFGTNLMTLLVNRRIDTVLLCGTTTSGCIRATAIDLLQLGYPCLVPRECVGDRSDGVHQANLFDIDAKYGDVISLDDALAYVASCAHPGSSVPG